MSCSTSSTGMSVERALDEVAHALALGGGEAGQRLVQQQHAWAGGERQAHIHQPLPAIGERAGLGLLDAGQAHPAQQLAVSDC
jgi:hypothetical protein